MRRCALNAVAGVACAILGCGPDACADDVDVLNDPPNDAVLRRTDSCNCGEVNPNWALPDVRQIRISGWQSPTASTDPYSGAVVSHGVSHLARIDIVLKGVICPPGPLGFGGDTYEPDRFGDAPVYGFFELDIDDDKDTGGEYPTVAATRFLGNVARFGSRPKGSLGSRAATSGRDLFMPWTTEPQVCLTGADWVVAFCGCSPVTVLSRSNPAHAKFQAGDTWIVEGRFFQRCGAQQNASLMSGGSAPGMYDPPTTLRFCHSVSVDETTITLITAIDQIGAGELRGVPPEPIDQSAANQTSIVEGVADLIAAARSRQLTGLAREVTIRWADQSLGAVGDPAEWACRFIVGTAYASPQLDGGLYVWTDVGFLAPVGDVNGDGAVTSDDRASILSRIAELDGGCDDGDMLINSAVTIINFGSNFDLCDINSDGVIDIVDLNLLPADAPCLADFDHSGSITAADIFDYLNAWFTSAPEADFDGVGGVTVMDIFAFLNAWFTGC